MIFLKSSPWLLFLFLFTGSQALAAEVDGQQTKTPIEYVEDSILTRPTTYASGANIRVRSIPSLKGRIIGVMKAEDKFEVVRKGDWYEIKSGPYKGHFIAADVVETTEEPAPVQGEAKPVAPKVAATPAPTAVPAAAESLSQPAVVAAPTAEAPAAAAPTATATNQAPATPFKVAPPQPKPVVAAPAPAPSAASAPGAANSAPPVVTAPTAPPPKNWDEKTEQRFQEGLNKVFKNKPKAEDTHVLMPVYLEDTTHPLGDIDTRVDPKSNTTDVEAKSFFQLLRKAVDEDWFEKKEVEAITPKNNSGTVDWLAVSAFSNTGITVEYDEKMLAIFVKVPPDVRPEGTQSMARDADVLAGKNIDPPSLFSTYINVNATETWDSRNDTFKDRRSPVQAQIESGTNIANFVIEGYGNYIEDRGNLPPGKEPFTRGDLRVVRDIQSLTARASAGDVVYPVQQFQVFQPMQGAAIRSQFSMSPSKLTYPSGDYEIYLKNKSKVYIWINDQLQQVLDLPAGRHQIKDFQYTGGMNNVRFDIVDEFGQTETQNHSYFSSTELLKKGLHQYSYAYGNPATISTVTGEKEYDTQNGTFSGFHRYGFTSFFSGGLGLQNDKLQTIGTLEGTWSLEVGYLKVAPAYSTTKSVGSGYALATYYTYVDYTGPEKTQRSYNVGLVHRSDLFAEFGTTTAPSVARPLEATMSMSRGLSKTMSSSFGFNYILNKKITTDTGNSYALRAGVSNRWSNGVSVNLMAAHTRTTAGADDISIMSFLVWSFPKERQTVSASLNSADHSSRVGWSYSPSSGADSASYQANYHDNATDKGYGGIVSINGNRARTSIGHESTLPKIDEPTTTVVESEQAVNLTTVQVGTALVFAGGRFGIGRPVTDGFAIFAPVKSLSGQRVVVNPDSQGGYLARSTWLGSAVVPEIGSYNPSVFVVEGKDLPVGLSIPQDHFNVNPKYKNGYAFRLGTDANVYIKVTILGPDGQPLPMAAGVATNLDDSDMPPVTFFTNAKGRVQSEGFKEGTYRIQIDPGKYKPLEFVIPEDTKDEFNLGTLQLQGI